jgi:hypothetical protein
MRENFMNACKPTTRWVRGLLTATVAGVLLGSAPAIAAITSGQNDGSTILGTAAGDYCMQQIYGGSSISSSNLLNCTANDVKISKATEFCVQALDSNNQPVGSPTCGTSPPAPGSDPVTCIANQNILLTAKFQVDVNASSRFDESFYFRVDGGATARGTGGIGGSVSGQCTLTNLKVGGGTPPNSSIVTEAKAGDRDSCGDLNQGSSFVTFTLPVMCVGDANGKLKLPNCTSWHSNSATKCELGVPTGDSAPETKSKCNCDDGFTLDILVEHPTISVQKDADPTQVLEPGGDVTYTVTVKNDGSQATVTLTKLTEDANNDGTVDFKYDSGSTPTLATICDTLTLAPGAQTKCTFTGHVSGSPGDNITDKACVSGTDSNGGSVGPSCDTAVVSIADVAPTAKLTKTAKEATCADIRYEVSIENTDTVDDLTLDSIHDDKVGGGSDSTGGDVSTTAAPHDNLKSSTCVLGTSIAKGGGKAGTYTCNFVVKNVCEFPVTDTVTAKLSDGDGGTPVTKTGSFTVNGITLQTP